MLELAILIGSVAICLSAFFSGAEIAFFSLSDMKVQSLIKHGRKNAKLIAQLKSNPDRLLTTILIGNNLVNIGSSAVVTYSMTELLGSQGVGLATGIMTLAILTFGEIIPKTIATRYASHIALRSARLLYTIQILLFPFVYFFEQFSKLPRLLLKDDVSHNKITDTDVASMATISYDQGGLLEYERDAITNILTLNDTQVNKIMTPKSQMIMVKPTDTLADIVKTVRSEHYSRIPVYDATNDTVTGFLFLKDILYYSRSEWKVLTAQQVARQPLKAHTTDLVHLVYNRLLKQRTHLVVVYDSRQKLAGMVTLEDVIEEVLGEIYDETD